MSRDEDAEKLTRAKASALALNMTAMRHDDGSLWLVDRDLFRELVDKGDLDPKCSLHPDSGLVENPPST